MLLPTAKVRELRATILATDGGLVDEWSGRDARRELINMSDNGFAALVTAMITVGVVTIAGIIGYCVYSSNIDEELTKRAEILQRSKDAAVKFQNAANLRIQWVKSCRLMPDEAERLTPQ